MGANRDPNMLSWRKELRIWAVRWWQRMLAEPLPSGQDSQLLAAIGAGAGHELANWEHD